jgi:hypothetical protein
VVLPINQTMGRNLKVLVLLLAVTACAQQSNAAGPPLSTRPKTAANTTADTPTTIPKTSATTFGDAGEACDGDVVFEHPPVDLEEVEYLTPFGLMTGSHVTPVDHQYFQNFADPDREIAVYSPGDGHVVSIQHFGTPVTEHPEGIVDDFRIIIEHTCSVSSTFIHIGELIPRLAAYDPGVGDYASLDEPVTAGAQIGTFTRNVDYNIVDLNYTSAGFVEPTSYEAEPWKIHVPDTFDYFTDEISGRMASLSLRSAEPRGGRFAYDIDGRLVGNWFLEGSGGYGGSDPERYWSGHLAFAYDHLDPNLIVVSIGTFDGESHQFAVEGNAPDPADVSVETGPIVYELIGWDYDTDGEHWDRTTFADDIEAVPIDEVQGVIAVELTDRRELRVEVLPGVTSADFAGFGPETLIYTR